MYNFVDIIWWHNLFHSSVITISFQKKVSDFGPKILPALVGTIGLHSNSGTSFMSMVIKGMIRITNEDRQLLSSLAILIIPLTARLIKEVPELDILFILALLSSLAILIIPLTARLIKEVPELECRPIVPTIAQKDFLGQNLKPFSEKKL